MTNSLKTSDFNVLVPKLRECIELLTGELQYLKSRTFKEEYAEGRTSFYWDNEGTIDEISRLESRLDDLLHNMHVDDEYLREIKND